MKKFVLVGIAALFLYGCKQSPESVQTVRADGFQVDILFTHEGCRMYRFLDGSRFVYYSNCVGSTQWRENCGKNCSRDQHVPTNWTQEIPQ